MGTLPEEPRRADAGDGDRRRRDYMSGVRGDPRARLNLGIRRRLAPLLEGDRRRIELMNGLLLSLPGSPIVYYGDEIGMGDNIYLGDRNGVRTPMQWNGGWNAGFSTADPEQLYQPPWRILFSGYQAVNVAAGTAIAELVAELDEAADPGAPGIDGSSAGAPSVAVARQPPDPRVLRRWRPRPSCGINLSTTAQSVGWISRGRPGPSPSKCSAGSLFPRIQRPSYVLTLGP